MKDEALSEALIAALSAVMDGCATPADWACVNAAWVSNAGLRERWALWHAAADGLRAADLPELHREPEALLASLHERMAAAEAPPRRVRNGFAPLAVTASFVAIAVAISALQPPLAAENVIAAVPSTTLRVQGLVGLSFAQAAAGRTLVDDAQLEVIDGALVLPLVVPDAAASQPHP